MPAVTLRVNKTTIKKYVRVAEDLTTQKYGVLKYLKSKGRFTFNNGGTDREWKVKYKRNSPVPMGDAEVMSFERVNRHETASISYRSQSMNESISKMERLQNKGPEAIVKLWDKQTQTMTDDFMCDLSKQVWLDGSEAGRENYLEGFQTIVNKAASSAAQYPVPSTSHTYAGLNTSPGYYGGSVTGGTYPEGIIDPEYYFWMPFQTKYTHASFGGSTWEDNCVEALRYTLTYVESSRGDEGRPDLLWLPPSLHAQFRNRQETKERIVVERGQDSDAVKLGFRAVNFEGVDLVLDFHVPADGVFGFKAEDTELASMQDQLLVPSEDNSIEDRTDRLALDFFGNMKHKPRSIVYLGDFA